MRNLQPNFANGATQMLRPAGKSQDICDRGKALYCNVFLRFALSVVAAGMGRDRL
jgi:hypothetical protein